jgi:Integrase core domain
MTGARRRSLADRRCGQVGPMKPPQEPAHRPSRRASVGWGIRERPISPRSPWQNPYTERLIGTLRRDCLDRVLIFGERHYYAFCLYIRAENEPHADAESALSWPSRLRRGAASLLWERKESGARCVMKLTEENGPWEPVETIPRREPWTRRADTKRSEKFRQPSLANSPNKLSPLRPFQGASLISCGSYTGNSAIGRKRESPAGSQIAAGAKPVRRARRGADVQRGACHRARPQCQIA